MVIRPVDNGKIPVHPCSNHMMRKLALILLVIGSALVAPSQVQAQDLVAQERAEVLQLAIANGDLSEDATDEEKAAVLKTDENYKL